MTIYIAICDDNIADRKQLERLLEREKDSRLKSKNDVLYIDSFGSEEALMHTPVKYDIFLIDITQSQSGNGMDLAKVLRKKGIGAPIILCSSSIDYTTFVNVPENITIINKPLNAGQISHLVDVACEWTKTKVPLLEIRCQKDTHFIKYTDLVLARKKAKFVTEILVADGTYMDMADSFKALCRMCYPYGCFLEFKNQLINTNHITSASNNRLSLSTGDYVKYTIFDQKNILKALANHEQVLADK